MMKPHEKSLMFGKGDLVNVKVDDEDILTENFTGRIESLTDTMVRVVHPTEGSFDFNIEQIERAADEND